MSGLSPARERATFTLTQEVLTWPLKYYVPSNHFSAQPCVSIWRNEGKRSAFHAITLSRIFMDAERHPKSAGSFGKNDLSAVATVVAQAERWVHEHAV